MTNFALGPALAAAAAPERPAVRLDDLTLSYRALDEAIAHAARLLRAEGVASGDRVGMQLPNAPYFPIDLPDRERKPGSIGVPVGGTEMRVVDDDDHEVPTGELGEIVLRGPFLMARYWEQAAATDEAMRGGWFHTGDIATVDADGYFFIVDRKKDLNIRGGYNVYPREVEEVLYAHPDVLEAAVVGVPHNSLGEEVGAAVVLKTERQVTADELRHYVRSKIAAYKYPREHLVSGHTAQGSDLKGPQARDRCAGHQLAIGRQMMPSGIQQQKERSNG